MLLKNRLMFFGLCLGAGLLTNIQLSHSKGSVYGYSGGTGSASDPYLISTPEDLIAFNTDIMVNKVSTSGKHYQLTADIDLTGYDTDSDASNGNWTPIGNSNLQFQGTFDGNYHQISNIEINLPSQNYVGFFGRTSGATIKNLAIEQIDVIGKQYTGSLVGHSTNGSISQVKTSGSVDGRSSYVGGFIGMISTTKLQDTYTLTNVIGSSSYTGGFTGSLASNGGISHSYASGSFSSKSSSNIGGFIGALQSGSYSASYWDIETSGTEKGYGTPVRTEGLSTDWAYHVLAFDFDSIWTLCDGATPSFQWEANSSSCQKVPKKPFQLEDESGYGWGPFAIKSEDDLFYLSEFVRVGASTSNYTFKLRADLDFTNYDTDSDETNGNWQPIGTKIIPFNGNFHGEQHTIKNLKINKSNYIGLFGVTKFADIRDLSVENIMIEGTGYLGGLAGHMTSTTVSNVSTTGNILGTGDFSGGLAGYVEYGTIDSAHSSLNLSIQGSSSDQAGGLVGYLSKGTIRNSLATGLVDVQASGSSIKEGGLVGNKANSNETITDSYWNLDSTMQLKSSGGNPVRTPALSTDLGYGVLRGFDFDSVWKICEGGTVSFQWQNVGCPLIKNEGVKFSGDGSAQDPYLITNESDLTYFNDYIYNGGLSSGIYFKLTNDLDFATHDIDTDDSNGNWRPIGDNTIPFKGHFDGNYHAISNLTINTPTEDYIGLFGRVSASTIKNLSLKNLDFKGNSRVGGLVGHHTSGTIENVSTSGVGVESGSRYIGGLIGYLENGTILKTYSTLPIKGTTSGGGLIGYGDRGTISESFSTGKVDLPNSTTAKRGGLVGDKSNITVTNSYWDIVSSGQSSSAGGTPLRTPALETERIYHILPQFDFNATWKLCEGEGLSFVWENNSCSTIPRQEFSLSGSGTTSDPYLIQSSNDLIDFNDYIHNGGPSAGVHFKLTNDLDFTTHDTDLDNTNGNWRPIGDNVIPFKGYFDGDYHTLSNLTIHQPTQDYIGVFGKVSASTIKNLSLQNLNFKGNSRVGGLVGHHTSGTIENVSTSGVGVESGSRYIGGLIGYLENGTILKTYSTLPIKGTTSGGGLIGYGDRGTISESFSTGEVDLPNSTTAKRGGLVGDKSSITVTNSYWDIISSEQSSSAGGSPLRTPALTTNRAYHVLSGFDFDSTWKLCEGESVSFRWEHEGCSTVNRTDFMLSGSGTSSNPYWITNELDLIYLNDYIYNGGPSHNLYFKLTNDLDFTAYDTDAEPLNGNWTPIGDEFIPFKGTFDGDYHTISNLMINTPTEDYIGLFGRVSESTIKNLSLKSINFKGNSRIGGLVGHHTSGTIENVSVSGTGVESQMNYVGGLIGYLNNGTLSNTYSKILLKGNNYGGGLIGYVLNGTISNSFSTGKVDLPNLTTTKRGGLIGYKSKLTINNSYWDTVSSGITSSNGGSGLSTEQMQGESAKTYMNGFDFENVWRTGAGYPQLIWEPEPAQKDCSITFEGTIQPTIASITFPNTSVDFRLDVNQPEGQQFIAPEFSLINNSFAPLKIELKAFNQLSNVFIDVLPTYFESWDGLNKEQSKYFALALVPVNGEGWLSLNEGEYWVADASSHSLGIVKGKSSVNFSFETKHGLAFNEVLNPQYQLTFIFDLLD